MEHSVKIEKVTNGYVLTWHKPHIFELWDHMRWPPPAPPPIFGTIVCTTLHQAFDVAKDILGSSEDA